MSEFYLENESGTRISLQSDDTCYYSNYTNLGYEVDSSYIRIADVFVRDYLNPKQTKMSVNLLFFQPSVYEKIQMVGNFIVTAEVLYVIYKPNLATGVEYRRQVEAESYLKTTDKSGYIVYTLSLNPLSLFYMSESTKFKIDNGDEGKQYDFIWDATYNDYTNRSIIIGEKNHVEVAFEVEIYGYTENPAIDIIQNNTSINKLTFPIIVDDGEKIKYSSLDNNLEVTLIDESGEETNLFNIFSLEDDVFFKIPKSGGTIKFTSDTDVMNTIILTVYYYYKVV